jgi:hypothetical protein
VNAAARDRLLFAAAAACGALVWWALAQGSAAFDAFDSPLYWTLGLPVTALACAVFGYAGARAAWRWPFVVFGAQFATATIGRGGDPGNLWPLSLVLFGGLAVGHLAPAFVGLGLRRIVESRRASGRAAAERGRAFLAETTARAAAGAPKAAETPPAGPEAS